MRRRHNVTLDNMTSNCHIYCVTETVLYSIGELARRAGVSRRTVRFYVQRGLIPEPFGRGRGRHYGAPHLAAVLRVKALQVEGLTLEAIRKRGLGGQASDGSVSEPGAPATAESCLPAAAEHAAPAEFTGQRWVRQLLLPGIELHLQEPHRPLTEEQLTALADFVHGLTTSGGTP